LAAPQTNHRELQEPFWARVAPVDGGPMTAMVSSQPSCGAPGSFAVGVAAASGPDASASATPAQVSGVDEIFAGLANFRSLNRERALASLREAVEAGSVSSDECEPLALAALQAEAWEARQGALLAAAEFVKAWDNPAFRERMLREVGRLLLDSEYRVRKAVAGVLRECCRRDGLVTYETLQGEVLGNIRETFTRAPDAEEATGGPDAPPPSPPTFLPDTEGWRTLETSMGALEAMMQGCGSAFTPHINDELLSLLAECSRHTNRFVREYAFFAYKDVFDVCDAGVFLSAIAGKTVNVVANGIRDNWSQVRYAGSVAARAFMEKAGAEKERFYPQLLGLMCLNRHYVAEGVRLYAQDTWRMVCGPQGGARLLMAHFDSVVGVYREAATAPNHAVREAACHCISEFAVRLAGLPDVPSPHRQHFTEPRVRTLLETLVAAFQDESWPVRDVASTAVGYFVKSFPAECAEFRLQLLDLWLDQLQDNIPSLRQNGAAALATAVGVWPDVLWAKVLMTLADMLPAAETQPEKSEVFADYTPSGPFSVPRPASKKLDDVVDVAFTDQTMYSCGSLAPKTMKKRNRGSGGGCMNCTVGSPHQPWEASEGMAHLLVELARLAARGGIAVGRRDASACCDELADLLPLFVRGLRCTHYRHSHLLRQRVCERLPALTEALTVRRMLPQLPDLLRICTECARQGTQFPALGDAADSAIAAWRRVLSQAEKDVVARALGLEPPRTLEQWIDASTRC